MKKWSGEKLRRLREEKFPGRGGLSEMARLLEVQPSHLQRYEKGERVPGVETAAAIAALLGVRVEELLTKS